MANNFLPFGASGNSTNLMTDDEYAASNARAAGFGTGYADERLANKAWLQSSVAAAVLMQFTADNSGQSVSDSLPVSTLESNFYLALVNAINAANFGVSSGTDTYTVTLNPAPTALATGYKILVYFNSPNTTSTPTLNLNGLGASSIVKQTGGALLPGDLSGFVSLIRDGSGKWRFNGLPQSAAGRIIGVQTFTASGTYTPTAGMTQIDVIGCGGGGGGGGASNPAAGTVSLGSPGGCGTNGRGTFTAAQVGASQPVTIGAGGGVAASSAGANGGSTSLGTLLTFPGGLGGGIFNGGTPPCYNGNGALANPATGANVYYQRGYTSDRALAISANASGMFCGPGGSGPYGNSQGASANTNGANATGYGAGGGGCAIANGGGPATGGVGAPGLLVIIEYGA